jgi:hypothetical protein
MTGAPFPAAPPAGAPSVATPPPAERAVTCTDCDESGAHHSDCPAAAPELAQPAAPGVARKAGDLLLQRWLATMTDARVTEINLTDEEYDALVDTIDAALDAERRARESAEAGAPAPMRHETLRVALAQPAAPSERKAEGKP